LHSADEPTNDLDVETITSLETAIAAFPGSVMVISHDRMFLDRLATHILAFEGDSQARPACYICSAWCSDLAMMVQQTFSNLYAAAQPANATVSSV